MNNLMGTLGKRYIVRDNMIAIFMRSDSLLAYMYYKDNFMWIYNSI